MIGRLYEARGVRRNVAERVAPFVLCTGLAFLSVVPPGAANAALTYQVIDLGALPGQTYSRAFGINQKGEIAGEAYSVGDIVQPVVWKDLSISTLKSDGWTGGAALDINDKGVAAGLLYSSNYQEAVLWMPDGTVTILPAGPCPIGIIGPCASQGYATAVNNKGDAAGESVLNATVWGADGNIRSLATDGVLISLARGINDKGTAVGWFDFDRNGPLPRKAFVWEEGRTYFDLGVILGGEGSQALAINKKGQVVGWVHDSDTTGHAFLWSEPDGLTVLPKPLNADQMVAFGINDRGDIVGNYSFADGAMDGFLWTDKEGLRTFSDLLPASGWKFFEVLDINDKGQIVGKGLSPTGQTHGFLLSPRNVPEPTTLALLALAGLGFARRRKLH